MSNLRLYVDANYYMTATLEESIQKGEDIIVVWDIDPSIEYYRCAISYQNNDRKNKEYVTDYTELRIRKQFTNFGILKTQFEFESYNEGLRKTNVVRTTIHYSISGESELDRIVAQLQQLAFVRTEYSNDTGDLVFYNLDNAEVARVTITGIDVDEVLRRLMNVERGLVTANEYIRDNKEAIDANRARIETNEQELVEHDGRIQTNTNNIADHETRIVNNTNNIETNRQNIHINREDIDANKSLIDTANANIQTNATNIQNNADAIENHEGRITNNSSDISTNATNIQNNSSAIAGLDERVTENESDIITNTNNITANKNLIDGQEIVINRNTANIETNRQNIETNTSTINSHGQRLTQAETDINANEGAISTNRTNITANSDAIAGNIRDIATNKINIGTNTSDIRGLRTDLNSNVTSLQNLIDNVIETTYTKTEIDNIVAGITFETAWQEPVQKYSDLATTYPNPETGWTVLVLDEGIVYNYNGSEWVQITTGGVLEYAGNTTDGIITSANFRDWQAKPTQAQLTNVDNKVTSNTGRITTNETNIATNTRNINTNRGLITDLETKTTAQMLTNENLNDLYGVNYWERTYFGQGGNTVTNKPSGVSTFYLYIFRSAGNYTTQVLFRNTIQWFVRTYNGSDWTQWVDEVGNINSEITEIQETIETLATKNELQAVDTRVSENGRNIQTNTNNIETNRTNIRNNTTNIGVINNNIESINDELAKKATKTEVQTIRDNVSSNTNRIRTNETNIQTNKNDITAINTRLAPIQLISQNLNDYQGSNFWNKRYYGDGSNTVINKPSGVSVFGLDVYRIGGNITLQVVFSSSMATGFYKRLFNGTTWTDWINDKEELRTAINLKANNTDLVSLQNKTTAQEINNGDLNTYYGSSYFDRIYYDSGTGTLNRPTGVSAYGLKIVRVASGWTMQLLFPANGNGYYQRVYNNTSWTDWTNTRIDTNGRIDTTNANVSALQTKTTSQVLTNQDLNNYQGENYYNRTYYAGGGNTVTNKPAGINSFGLSCKRVAGGFTLQILYPAGNTGYYQRVYNGTTWTEWSNLIADIETNKKNNLFVRAASDTITGDRYYKVAEMTIAINATNLYGAFLLTELYNGTVSYSGIGEFNIRIENSVINVSQTSFVITSIKNSSVNVQDYIFINQTGNLLQIFVKTDRTYDGWRIDFLKDFNYRSGQSFYDLFSLTNYANGNAQGVVSTIPTGTKIYPTDTFKELKTKTEPQLISTGDLNTMYGANYWNRTYSATSAESILNRPEGIVTFGLVIVRVGSGLSKQILFGSDNLIYERIYNGTTWNAWANQTIDLRNRITQTNTNVTALQTAVATSTVTSTSPFNRVTLQRQGKLRVVNVFSTSTTNITIPSYGNYTLYTLPTGDRPPQNYSAAAFARGNSNVIHTGVFVTAMTTGEVVATNNSNAAVTAIELKANISYIVN